MRVLKIIGLIVGVVLGLYFSLIGMLVTQPYVTNYVSRTEFDSERWKNWEITEGDATLRWDMMVDLEEQYDLKGMTEIEIVRLLGEPGLRTSVEWTYDLGMARNGIDTGTLSLTFENGKVNAYHVRQG